MNATILTAIAGVIVAALTGTLVPVFIYRRTNSGEKAHVDATAEAMEEQTEAVTMRDVNKAIAKERDDLRKLLNEEKREHTEIIRQLRAEYDQKLRESNDEVQAGKVRIREQQEQIDSLYRRLVLRDYPGTP